jgi:FAD/FMN-containing dehydrogenase
MDKNQIAWLTEKFANRVNFDEMERRLYSHDVGAIPTLIKPLIGDTLPDAIVQPQNEAELTELVSWANKNNIPLTPRAKASSGYGGVIPVKKGIVVDFFRLNQVLAIDKDALMPKVMDTLLPHMIGDLVLLVTGPMIDYLTGKAK